MLWKFNTSNKNVAQYLEYSFTSDSPSLFICIIFYSFNNFRKLWELQYLNFNSEIKEVPTLIQLQLII